MTKRTFRGNSQYNQCVIHPPLVYLTTASCLLRLDVPCLVGHWELEVELRCVLLNPIDHVLRCVPQATTVITQVSSQAKLVL